MQYIEKKYVYITYILMKILCLHKYNAIQLASACESCIFYVWDTYNIFAG